MSVQIKSSPLVTLPKFLIDQGYSVETSTCMGSTWTTLYSNVLYMTNDFDGDSLMVPGDRKSYKEEGNLRPLCFLDCKRRYFLGCSQPTVNDVEAISIFLYRAIDEWGTLLLKSRVTGAVQRVVNNSKGLALSYNRIIHGKTD